MTVSAPETDWVFVPPEPDTPCVTLGCGHPAVDHSAIGERAQVCTVRGCECSGLTVHLQRPNTFLVRPVDADRVREAISGVVADAINKAAETLNKVRAWCDTAESGAYCPHDAPPLGRDCETCDLVAHMVEDVRNLLPPLPEAAEEVDMDGTRVTRDREYPGDDNHWRVTGGGENEGVDTGN